MNERVFKGETIYGELDNPRDPITGLPPIKNCFSLQNASHTLENFILEDNKIYADVKYLKNKNGEIAEMCIDGNGFRFGIRSSGTTIDGITTIDEIYSFDIIEK